MYTRIQQRNLDRLSTKLNEGLSNLHEVWGHGCPTGMEPLLFEDIYTSNELIFREQFAKNPATSGLSNIDISKFIYSPEESIKRAEQRVMNIESDIHKLKFSGNIRYDQVYDIKQRMKTLKQIRLRYIEHLKAKRKAYEDMQKRNQLTINQLHHL